MRYFNIGGPIAVAVLGAILYFALSDGIPGVDLRMIGLILMVAAAIWLVLGFIGTRPRSHVTSERTTTQGPGGAQNVEREVRQDEV